MSIEEFRKVAFECVAAEEEERRNMDGAVDDVRHSNKWGSWALSLVGHGGKGGQSALLEEHEAEKLFQHINV